MLGRLYKMADRMRQRGLSRRMNSGMALGRHGEDIAHRFLQRAGIIVVARNYRTASGSGEIDLVGWEGETLVVIEVKSRQTDDYGAPDRAIGPEKMTAVIRAAREFARHAEVPWERVRFDVVTVVFARPPVVTHYRDAFRSTSLS